MKPIKLVIFGWASSIHIMRWAKGLSDRGCIVKVVSLGGEPIDGIETVIFPRTARRSYLKFAKQAAVEAIKFNPDLVHVHYAGGFCQWGLKTKNIPLVVSVWGSDINLENSLLKNFYIKKVLKKADAITATSKSLKSDVVKFYPKIEDKTEIIPFGVKIPKAIIDHPPVNTIRICFTKSLKKIYGLDVLLQAISIVRNYIPNIEVNLAGEGEMKTELESLIKELNLTEKVNLVGFIDNENIYEFIGNHHLMVMPSLQEAFGVSALEASAVSRPVVATNVGGVPEVVIDNKTGILVKPNDSKDLAEAIIKLCSEPSLMIKMGQEGHEFVKNNYAWDDSLDKMISLYQKIINEKDK
jgi:glycosyltransferase involved in cell wall biosynthesis